MRKTHILFLVLPLLMIFVFQNASQYENATSSQSGELSFEEAQEQAVTIYRRIAGVTMGMDSQTIQQMALHIRHGRLREAVEIPLKSSDFYQITVRNLAGRMSNRDLSSQAPLTDFVATFIGAVRDDLSAVELLTGNFYYRAYNIAGVPQNVARDLVKSNIHYEALDQANVNLADVLQREDGQKALSQSGGVTDLADTAGLFTTRGFLAAHATGGTNRRIVEYAFKVFLCTPIDEWASTSSPDDHVGRDIGRTPIADYNNKCKGCHTGMDAFRPATAFFDFKIDDANNESYIAYNYTYRFDPSEENPSQLTEPVPEDQQRVPAKFRRGQNIYSGGFVVKDDRWKNYASQNKFGWRGPASSGSGMRDFGYAIASSRKFSQCMVKNVYKEVCRTEKMTEGLLTKLTNTFEEKDYNIKNLFSEVIMRPECAGVGVK